jgi:hypothetical protein
VPDDLRLADVLAALSVATDLGMGQEPEKAVRTQDRPHRAALAAAAMFAMEHGLLR